MNNKFITEFFDDSKKYFNMITFFSWILSRDDFAFIVHNLSEEIGFGDEKVGCYFSNIFEDCNEQGYFEEGVGFYYENTEIEDLVVDYSMFIKCVELAYSIYCGENGKNEEIEKDIENMRNKYFG